jgi:hypothetical protein
MGKDTFTKIPNGINGIEDRLSVVWNNGVRAGLLSPSEFVRATSTQAAHIFNLYPRKGVIAVGADADVVVWDGSKSRVVSRHTHHHGVDFNIFEGQELYGVAETTISGGVIKWRCDNYTNADIESHRGSGRLLTRPSFGHAFSRVAALDRHYAATHQAIDRPGTDFGTEPDDPDLVQGSTSSHADVAVIETACSIIPPDAIPNSQPIIGTPSSSSISNSDKGHLHSLESILWQHIPEGVARDEVSRLVYGTPNYAGIIPQDSSHHPQFHLARRAGEQYKFDLPGVYSFQPSAEEQSQERRLTRVAAIQNSIALPTDRPVMEQKHAMFDKIGHMIEAAAHSGANVICLQVSC